MTSTGYVDILKFKILYKNGIKKIQMYVFMDGDTMLTDVVSHVITGHVQTSVPRGISDQHIILKC